MLRALVLSALPLVALACTKVTGDGTGGTEEKLKTTDTFEDCVLYVRGHRPNANGVTWSPTSNACYAEFGMSGNNNNAAWETCMLTAAEMQNNGGQIVCSCTTVAGSSSSCGSSCVTATNTQALGSFVPNIPFDPQSEFEKDWEASANPLQIRGMSGKWVCQAATMSGPVPEDIECHEDDRELRVTWDWGDGTVDVPVKRTVVQVYNGNTVVATKVIGQKIMSVEADKEQVNYKAAEAIDDVYTSNNNGWAYNAAPPATAAFKLDGPQTISSVTILSGVSRNDHHVNDFELAYTADPTPTLAGATWTQVANPVFDTSVAGSAVSGNRLTCTGQDEVIVNFDEISATAMRLIIRGSDSNNENSVLTEFFVGAAESQIGEAVFTGLGKNIAYTVKITTDYAAEAGTFPSAVTENPTTCKIETCPAPTAAPARMCSAAPGDAANIPTNAKTCKTIKAATPNAGSAFYQVDPEGDGTFVNAYCDMDTDGGGWTLAISQMNGLFTADIETYTGVTPATDTSGALQYYLHADLTCVVSEIRVHNVKGQSYTYDTSKFVAWNGALTLNDDNIVMSYNNDRHIGVIAGDHYPVLYHYDVDCGYKSATYPGNSCTAGTPCWGTTGCGQTYSHGGLSVWDFNTTPCTANPDNRAHFGGTTLIERSWATRGTFLWVR